MNTKVEYRVRPVTRYVVTRYFSALDGRDPSGVETKGEYDNADIAYEVGTALAKEEARRLKLSPGDERVIFPIHPAYAPMKAVSLDDLDSAVIRGASVVIS